MPNQEHPISYTIRGMGRCMRGGVVLSRLVVGSTVFTIAAVSGSACGEKAG